MKKYFKVSVSTVLLLLVAILGISFGLSDVDAASTHSIDLESGSSQYLSATDSSSLSITGDMTLELWIKPESLPGTNSSVFLVSKDDLSDGSKSFQFRITDDAGTMQLRFYVSEAGTGATETTAQLNHTPTTGTWAHYAVVYTSGSSPQAEFFKDGVSLGTANFNTSTNANSIHDNGSTLRIGAAGSSATGFFDGLIDDVRIWSSARTSSDISTNRAKELSGGEATLKGYWKLNNALGDTTSFGNTLTNNGTAVFSTDVPTITSGTKVRKASDTATTTTTTLYADNELSVVLEANKTYRVEGSLFVQSASATPDFQFAFAGPSGSSSTIGYTIANGTAGGSEGGVAEDGATSDTVQLNASSPGVININGIVITGATAGDLTLKWAQVTSSATSVILKKNSNLKVEEF